MLEIRLMHLKIDINTYTVILLHISNITITLYSVIVSLIFCMGHAEECTFLFTVHAL